MARRNKKDPRKLTLRLEGEVIDAAKDLAARQGLSLSEMVENYFRNVAIREPARRYRGEGAAPTGRDQDDSWMDDLSPKTRFFVGIARPDDGEKPLDEEDYWRYLEEKHR